MSVELENYLVKFKLSNLIYGKQDEVAVFKSKLSNKWTEPGQSLSTLDEGKTVVVKCCLSNENQVLEHFSEAYGRLKVCVHKNIVTAFFSGTYDPPAENISMNAFVMEAGERSLAELLKDTRTFPTDKKGCEEGHLSMAHCMSWMKQIASALAFLHHENILHRDVKPRNIIMFDNSTICKLCDFDDSRELSSLMTPEVGTSNFMAPEVAKLRSKNEEKREYTEKCDCYSFGKTILAIIFRSPDCENVPKVVDTPETSVGPVGTATGNSTLVSVFIATTEADDVDLKESVFEYCSHKNKFGVIKKILDCALQADWTKRQSSNEILSLLEQPDAEAEDTPKELIPIVTSSSIANSSPEIPTVRSVSRKSRTVIYQATSECEFTSDLANQLANRLNNLGPETNPQVDNILLAAKHQFIVRPRSNPNILWIEHDMGSTDGSDLTDVAEFCKKEKHLGWLKEQIKETGSSNALNFGELQLSIWDPKKL